MQILKADKNINYLGARRITVSISVVLILISIVSLATRGLNFGLDFTGGTLIEVVYPVPVERADVEQQLIDAGIEGAQVQRFSSTNFAIRLSPEAAAHITGEGQAAAQIGGLEDVSTAISSAIQRAVGPTVEVKPPDYVGPQVGRELAENGIIAVLVVLTGIMIYIALRFEWKFSVAVVAGELHDVLLTLGFFSLTGQEFDLTVLAAILAVDGYSVNDKIVIADRIRELFRSTRKAPPVEILNIAVNQTLARTIMTSLTTLLTVVALYLFGGPTLEGFSLALIVGIVIGTLSSIFFATPILLALGINKQDLMPKARDEAELARRP